MIHGFLRVCTLSPSLRVADCPYNAKMTVEAMRQAAADGAQLAVFPELGLTGYTCSDLFLQQPLQRAAEEALRTVLETSKTLALVTAVGLPVNVDGKLYNCAAIVCRGRLLGLVPKTYIPNYGEFYERRHFSPAPSGVRSVRFAGQETLFGTKLLFRCGSMPEFVLAAEICEDLWAPLPPSTAHALAGATVVVNLSASDETAGKAEYRRQLVAQQSARLLCAYLYSDAGHGESTTDMVFAAHDLICENGALLAESRPFGDGRACTELDLGRLAAERCRSTSFEPSADSYTSVEFDLPLRPVTLTRRFSPTPFVPSGDTARGTLRADFGNSGRRPCKAARARPRKNRRHRHFRRSGQLPCAAGRRPRDEKARPSHDGHPRRDHALLRHHAPDALQCGDPVSGAWRLLPGNSDRGHRPQPLPRHRSGRGRAGCDL